MLPAEQVRRDGEFGGRPADQHGDGVLVLRALHAHIDELRLRVQNLGLGGGHVAARDGVAGFVLILHDRQAFLLYSATVRLSRSRNESAARKIEIGGGKLRLRGQLGVGEIGGARLRGGGVGLDLAAHLAPDIEVPAAGELRDEGCRVDAVAVSPAAGTAAEPGSAAAGVWPGPRAGKVVVRRSRSETAPLAPP